MGMTIEEAIPILHDMYNYYNDTDIDAYVAFDKEDNNAIKTALNTMRKYQKIQEIIKDHDADMIPEDYWYIDRVRKVLKHGNDD